MIATQPQSLTNVSSSHCPTLQPTASTTHVGTHPVRPAGSKGSASTAMRETTTLMAPVLVRGYSFLQTQRCSTPHAQLWALKNLRPQTPSPQRTAISCIINFAFPSYSGIQPGAQSPTNICLWLPVVNSMQLSLQEASDHVPHISTYFLAYTDNTDLAILLNKDTFEQTLLLPRLRSTLRAKILGAWYCSLSVLCFVVLLFLVHPTVTFCSAHIHNLVAKKRDPSTGLLQFPSLQNVGIQ